MPVDAVRREAVTGGQVETAAEPPEGILDFRFSFFDYRAGLRFLPGEKKPYVQMHGRHVGIAGMDDEGHAEGFVRLARQFGPSGGGRGGQGGAGDMGETDAGLLEDGAIAQHPGTPAPARGSRPGILLKTAVPVLAFQRGTEVVLQLEQVGADGVEVGWHGQIVLFLLIVLVLRSREQEKTERERCRERERLSGAA